MGVWNGWAYGISVFQALNFQTLEPKIWKKSLFLRMYKEFATNFGL